MKERKNEQKNATHSEIKCATESNKKKVQPKSSHADECENEPSNRHNRESGVR